MFKSKKNTNQMKRQRPITHYADKYSRKVGDLREKKATVHSSQSFPLTSSGKLSKL